MTFFNINSYEYYDYLISNPKMYSQVVMAGIHDNNELLESNDAKEFLAIVLSGENTAITGMSNANSMNNPELIQFDDGISRIAVKIRILDDAVHNTGDFNFTDMVPNPFASNLTEAERQRRISQHPVAFTLYPSFEQNTISFGTVVSIREEDGVYFIIKNLTAPVSTGFSAGGGALGPSAAFTLGGKPVTMDNQIPNAVYPVPNMKFTSGFKHPTRQGHQGVDIGEPIGTPTYSVLAGTVVKVVGVTAAGLPQNPTGHMNSAQKKACQDSGGKGCKGFGVYILVDHGMVPDKGGTPRRILTVYGHLSQTFVKKGDTVTIGQNIGLVGNEGSSGGPHLHFEVWFDQYYGSGKPANPVAVFGWFEESKCNTLWKMPCGWAGWQDDGAEKRAIYSDKAKKETGLL